jgi:hypothetical protein
MEKVKIRSRIKAQARAKFPWLATSKSGIAIQCASKSPLAYTVTSVRSSTSSLSLDQPVIGKSAMPQCRSEELYQPEQTPIRCKPELPIIPALEGVDCDFILNNYSSSYAAEQSSTIFLRQSPSLALLTTASECLFATVELLDRILLLLPVNNIFILQRVSGTWK